MVEEIIKLLGGKENILAVTNCMTRLRVTVKKENAVNESKLKSADGVLGLIHDRNCYYEIVVGPGKSRKYADKCHEMGFPATVSGNNNSWQENKKEFRSKQSQSKFKSFLKVFGDIFIPLIPGTIVAGLCAGFAMLIAQIVPNYDKITFWLVLHQVLTLINVSFTTYICAWAGYRTAERFGGTPILGGMLGMITSLDGINTIAKAINLYDNDSPLNSILCNGKGGIIAAILGAFVLSFVEKKIRKIMPESLDTVFTPLLSLLICVIPYIFIFMPLLGYVASGICFVFSKICLSQNIFARMIAGFVAAFAFLPMVATGTHHGLVALYTVQLQQFNFITLYPALSMAGASQVGAAVAIWIKAKRAKNKRLVNVIKGALPSGILGVGEPLLYGMSVPMGKPLITAGLGGAFGGAFVMLMQVASTTWGPSGLLAIFVMTAGSNSALMSVLYYVIGLAISYVMGGIITYFALKPNDVLPEGEEVIPQKDNAEEETRKSVVLNIENVKSIKHGETVMTAGEENVFCYTVTDKTGIHARPAGAIVKLAKGFNCKITLSANGKSANADSIINIMSLGAKMGTRLKVKADGEDAEKAINELKSYFQNNL